MTLKFGSLYTGIGGLDLGLERAGMKCVWQVEISDFCRQVLQKHWPDVRKFHDVSKFCRRIYDCRPQNEDEEIICPRCDVDFGECECIGTDQFMDEWEWPDIIVGGDPCQQNSNANRSGGTTAPSLGAEFIRIVNELRPRFVLRENPSVVSADAPWPWRRFRSNLESLGYNVVPFRVRACCVGADFRRDRLFLFAELQSSQRQGLERNVCKILADAHKRRRDADIAGPDRWYATPRICGKADGISHRVDRLRSLGNSVCPHVAEYIGKLILEAVRYDSMVEGSQ